MGRTHEVANLAAGKGGHPVGMFVGDQPVPQRPLIGRGNLDDRDVPHLQEMSGHPDRFRHRRIENPWPGVTHTGPGLWQDDVRRCRGKRRQRLHAPRNLRTSGRVDERKLLAHPAPKRAPAREVLLRQHRDNPRACRIAAQGATDLRLCHHEAGIHRWRRGVQP